jgi:hypothetical protein
MWNWRPRRLKSHDGPQRRSQWALDETAQLHAQLIRLDDEDPQRLELQRRIREVSSWLTQDEIVHLLTHSDPAESHGETTAKT